MLYKRGPVEEEIRRAWTGRSLLSGRMALYLCYLGCIMSLVGFLSFAALQHALELLGTLGVNPAKQETVPARLGKEARAEAD